MEERNYNQNNQGRRPNRGGGGRYRGGHGGGGRGRGQRPLLTSATNGALLGLVALMLMSVSQMNAQVQGLVGVMIIGFVISAIVSYVAQRVSMKWVEKVSDAFFLISLVLVLVVACQVSGVLTLL